MYKTIAWYDATYMINVSVCVHDTQLLTDDNKI